MWVGQISPLQFKAWGKISSLASYRVKEGGIERLIVALIKRGVGLNLTKTVSVETLQGQQKVNVLKEYVHDLTPFIMHLQRPVQLQ